MNVEFSDLYNTDTREQFLKLLFRRTIAHELKWHYERKGYDLKKLENIYLEISGPVFSLDLQDKRLYILELEDMVNKSGFTHLEVYDPATKKSVNIPQHALVDTLYRTIRRESGYQHTETKKEPKNQKQAVFAGVEEKEGNKKLLSKGSTRIQTKSNIAFERELIDTYPDMARQALIFTANKEHAADLLQNTTLRILQNQDKYVNPSHFIGWMRTVMRHIFINDCRRFFRDQTFINTDSLEWNFNVENFAELYVDPAIEEVEIHQMLDTLKDDLKVPFLLKLQGFTYQEVAEELNLPLNTVKSRIFRARKLLKAFLE